MNKRSYMNNRHKKIFIVIPAYNAEKTIEKTYSRIPPGYFRIVIIDDGSSDNTGKVANKLNATVITHDKNKGYGAAQKTGFKHALKNSADAVILLHADGQYDPEEIPKLINSMEKNNADIVLGSRVMGGKMLEGGMPYIKYIGNRVLTWLENLAFGMNITEYHTGYRVYSRKALQFLDFENLSDKFHFDSEILVNAMEKKLKIVEVPISTHYSREKSYLNPLTYGMQIIWLIIKYKFQKNFYTGDRIERTSR